MGEVLMTGAGGKVTAVNLSPENIKGGVVVTVKQGTKTVIQTKPGTYAPTLKRVQVASLPYSGYKGSATIDIKQHVPQKVWPALTSSNFAFSSVSYNVRHKEGGNWDSSAPNSATSLMSYDPSSGELSVQLKTDVYQKIVSATCASASCSVAIDCFYIDVDGG